MAATLSDLVYEAKREAGALVAELELEFGPLGVAMKALRLYERIQAIERELEQQRRPANEIPSGCVRCAFGALPFVPSRSGRGMERCDCARGRWLQEHERHRGRRRMRVLVDHKRRAAGER